MTKKTEPVAILTKKELAIVRRVGKRIKTERGACFTNAQRLVHYSYDGNGILYHEGSLRLPGRTLAHAWNSINGKLIDVSHSFQQIVDPELYHLYECKVTCTKDQILAEFIERYCWHWMGDSTEYGELLSIT
jgi:hypothetical protein